VKNHPLAVLRILAVSVLLAALTPAVAPAADDVRGAIEAVGRQFSADFAKSDAAALAGHYAEDAMVLPPNAEIVKGRAAIQAFWQSNVETMKHLGLTTTEVHSGGDYAYEVGTYEIGTAPDAVVDRGKFMVVWKKAGGKWWIYRDMFSSNAPPPAPASN
jgi:ketosteroid isomerase-like protein